MYNVDTFVIEYDPLERTVSFAVCKYSGLVVGIDNGEQLKLYENTEGLFSLEGHYDKVFDYIKNNFDGKPEVILRVDVPQQGYDKRQVEFERFDENVEKHNKSSDIKINLQINKIRLDQKQETTFPVVTSQLPDSESIQPKGDTSSTSTIKPMVKVAVIGKISSGKTTLIEGLTKHNNSTCVSYPFLSGTMKYYDSNNNVEWYEIDGIDFGKENVANASDMLDKLITDNSISVVLYCLNSRIGKIEDVERNFVVDVKQKYPNTFVYVVITVSVDESSSRLFADVVSNTTKQTKVFTVLAKEMRTNAGFLQPYGLDDITKNIYGVLL